MSVRDYLQSRHVSFETLLHAPSPSATRFAQSVHYPGRWVAKSVLLKGEDGGFLLAVLPSTHRIDLPRFAAVVGGRVFHLANEDDLERVFPDCERGALPPFGRLYGLTTVVDASLSGGPEIVIEGNARHEGLRLRYRDYEAVEEPVRARFATAVAPRKRRADSRRAG